MKTLFGILLSFTLFATTLHAQTTIMRPAVAFVKQSRDTLFIKQPDSAVQAYYLPDIINQTTFGSDSIDFIHNLAVIGLWQPDTSQGRLLLAGNVSHLTSNGHQTFQGLFSVPWPLTTWHLTPGNPHVDSIDFILAAPNAVGFRPIGTLSNNGTQWWVAFSSQSGGNLILQFYHGNTLGSGKIDSTTVVQTGSGGDVLPEGVQVSNIVLDKGTNPPTMIAAVADGILSVDQGTHFDALLLVWHLGSDVVTQDIGSVYHSLMDPIFFNEQLNGLTSDVVDSGFGLTVIPNNNGSSVLLGLIPNRTNDIQFYNVSYNGTPDLSNLGPMMLHTIVPSAQDFFAGQNCGSVGYKEDIVGAGNGQCGNGGDMSVNSVGGDSVLFITHESTNSCADRKKNSAIWMYDLNAGASNATLIYNDSNAQELQPVWVVTPYVVPPVVHYPGLAWQQTYSGAFGVVDTGKTGNLMFTATNDSLVNVTIDSAHIGGQNASEMTLTPLTYPITLTPGQTQNFTVTFSPVAPAGSKKAALKVYFEGASHDSLTQQMTGVASIPAGSVAEDAALAASITTLPNPFSASVTVQITSPDAGPLSILVHDAMGRTVYRSETRETAAGSTENFSFDAKSLGLADGVYYVTAFLGDRQASREVVFAR